MKISIPRNYSYKEDLAYLNNGILYIQHFDYFKAVMHDITYLTKNTGFCYFCSARIKRPNTKSNIKMLKKSEVKTASLDHMIPQDLGGPTIPDNLFVVCQDCNSLKSNMLEEEFAHFLSLDEAHRKRYFESLQSFKEEIKKSFYPLFPRDWLVEKSIDEIFTVEKSEVDRKTKAYKRASAFYKKYGGLNKVIILDRNSHLLDGYYTYLFAKDNSISNVLCIVLENVELTC